MVLAVILFIVVARLAWLQIFDGPTFAQAAKENRTNTFVIQAKRGTIYDRNGNVLAASVECKTFYANPREIQDAQKAAEILATNFGGNASDYLSSLTKDTTFVYLKKKVDADVAKKTLADLKDVDINGIYTLSDMKRIYPYGAVAGQVLGVVGVDGEGLTGLELQYNDVLSGKNGEKVMETGLYGTPIAGGAYEEIPAKNGTDIMISLDINIQRVAEEQISEGTKKYGAESGQVTVMEPKTGEILAMCSTPLLDLTNTANAKSDAFTLANVTKSYEPGSIMKVLVAGLGLYNQSFTPETVFSIPASIKVGTDSVTDDDKRSVQQDMTPGEILRRSSNVGAVMMGKALGTMPLAEGFSKFGMGTKTGIDYPGETAGIMTDLSSITSTTTGAMSFGQAMSVPTVQTVRAFGAIANNGVLETPHFLLYEADEKVDWPQGEQVISSEACSQVIDMMRNVVTSGTARPAQVPGYDIAAKTGTGEQASSSGGYKKYSFFTSLVGFAPASDPQILVYVGYNGVGNVAYYNAAPTFSVVMGEALLDMGIGTTQ